MKSFLLLTSLAAFMAACGSDHDVNVGGKVKTETEGETKHEIIVRYEIPVCERPDFTPAQTIRCLSTALSYMIEVKGLEEGDLDNIADIVGATQ